MRRQCLVIALTVTLVSAREPNARTPGQWLRGEVVYPVTAGGIFDDATLAVVGHAMQYRSVAP